MSHAIWRLGVVLAAVLVCAAPGQAQPANPEVPAATRTVKLTLEQRHVIRELVRELKVGRAPEDDTVAAGDEVPGKIELHPVPPLIGQKVPQIRSHRLYVTPRRIVIVDPQERRVAEVIE